MTPAELKDFASFNFTATRSVDQLSLLFLSRGLDQSQAKAIREDLLKRSGGVQKLPRLEVRSHEIFLQDKSTGLKITSSNPLKISRGNTNWTLNEKQSFEHNYFSLCQFLESKKTASIWKLFISEAYGKKDDFGGKNTVPSEEASLGGAMGLNIGSIAGLLLVTFAPVVLPTLAVTAIAAGIGTLAIGTIFYLNGKKVDTEERNLAGKIINSNARFACSSTQVIISATSEDGESMIRIDRNSPINPIKMFNNKNELISSHKIPAAQQAQIVSLMKDCKSNEDAAAITKEWKKTIKDGGTALLAAQPKIESLNQNGAGSK